MTVAQDTKTMDTYTLFMDTLNVMNEAMAKHRDTPVLKQILSLTDKALSGRKFGVAVYKESPDKPFDYFTVKLVNGKIELDSRGKNEPDIAWKVSQEYLAKVSDNPDEYVNNPAKLDWDWLKSRLKS